jgi:hypothetical protein
MADETPTLSIAVDKVCLIAAKARQFDAKDVATVPDDASNPTDDGMLEVLEDRGDDPVVQELVSYIGGLTEDEQIDLVTLAWIGRGDGDVNDWTELRAEAERLHNRLTARYLLGMPLLAEFLESGLVQFDLSCEGVDIDHA